MPRQAWAKGRPDHHKRTDPQKVFIDIMVARELGDGEERGGGKALGRRAEAQHAARLPYICRHCRIAHQCHFHLV